MTTKGLGVTGAGVVYVKDIEAYLDNPNAKKQLEALARISEKARKKNNEKDV